MLNKSPMDSIRGAKKFNILVAFAISNTLKEFIKMCKDKLEKLSCCDVVYKINCVDCEASYVGQTKRRLQTRIYKHKADIKKGGRSFLYIGYMIIILIEIILRSLIKNHRS